MASIYIRLILFLCLEYFVSCCKRMCGSVRKLPRTKRRQSSTKNKTKYQLETRKRYKYETIRKSLLEQSYKLAYKMYCIKSVDFRAK